MMLRLTDIQDWISGLGVASADHVYIGKLDNKHPPMQAVRGSFHIPPLKQQISET